ncbi:3'-5' exonuclease family protein [Noviherbaspirillum sedimenti]|uniref:Excinuclease cho n=1 Tax=Noviherbaspirillum sedimenti TaxID=2320865 RepID=A0A3A3GNT0_9BURK|nr:3'-5' exonuclease family protein [Noviherbaspirillum sedimenti]RJG03976.1 ethanolamine utilization protein [Noviherbaspirillum sedimenti]
MPKHEKLIFVDLETTGANPIVDRITEIGIVEVQGDQVSHWSTLVNPEIPIPPFIQSLTGISDAMVASAPVFGELAEEVLARLQGGLFIAHNARFDYGFLRNAFKAAGHSLRAEVLCTVKLSRKLFPEYAKHNLDALVQRHQLQALGRHRALADADLLWQLWRKLAREIAPDTFEQALAQLLQRPSTPTHLAPEVLDDIPDTPGVYLFYGENDALLYVGKSVHLRQRVLSHFNGDHRLFQDMRMSQQIHRLEWRETAGELGALLLEAQLIKDRQPIHNRALRRQRGLCAWQLRAQEDGATQPVLVNASDMDFGAAEGLYGLFSSRKKAEASLRDIAESHQLCLVQLGLESRVEAGKPCFAHQLRRCRGACVGKEPQALHQARLQAALASLKLVTWPHAGPVALIETAADGSREEAHVVHNWCYLGSASAEADVWSLLEQSRTRPAFDVDTYKILVRALAKGQVRVRPLPRLLDQAAA